MNPQNPQSKAAKKRLNKKNSQVLNPMPKPVLANANKVMKALAKDYGSRALKQVSEPNDYLRCLLNPEQYQSSYPDSFGDKTTVAKFVINQDVTWDANGNYYVWVNPTLFNTVAMGAATPLQAAIEFKSANNYARGSNVTGLPINSGTTVPLSNAKFVGYDPSNALITFKNAPDGDDLLPLFSSTATLTVDWTQTGTSSIIPFFDDVAQTPMTTSTTSTMAIPNGVKHLRFSALGGGTNKVNYITTINFSVVLTPTSTSDASIIEYYSVPDYDDIAGVKDSSPIYEEYRVVAMSVLMTYEGDTLYNGGNITGRIMSGGENPGTLGFNDYASISSLPDSYERPLTMGAYSFWKPTDDKDMYFRDANYDNTPTGDLPSVVFAGTVKNPTNAILRLRVCLVVEAKTYKSYIGRDYSVVAPNQIASASVALRGIPRIMENPLHLEDIRNFLRNLVKKGEQVYEVGKRIAPYAVPMAKILGSFLL